MAISIKCERIEGESFDQALFEQKELRGYLSQIVPVANSIYEAAVVDSDIERKFAAAMDKRVDDVRLCVKSPSWFFVQTPLGQYNPDWAIVLERDEKVYLVRETKGDSNIEKLAADERDKVKCGIAYFKALAVDFAVVTSAGKVEPGEPPVLSSAER